MHHFIFKIIEVLINKKSEEGSAKESALLTGVLVSAVLLFVGYYLNTGSHHVHSMHLFHSHGR
jgi:hypothetical protein